MSEVLSAIPIVVVLGVVLWLAYKSKKFKDPTDPPGPPPGQV